MNIKNFEVVIYGGTPGGIGASLAAARKGRKTLLIESSNFIGGLMTSGLGRTDIKNTDASGSIFKEFMEKILNYYVETYGENSQQVRDCNNGLWFEPSVASKIFKEMLNDEINLTTFLSYELLKVERNNSTIKKILIKNKKDNEYTEVSGNVFIDATYEGDLSAKSGVPYMLGRESRDEWNEEYAGVLYMDYHEGKEVFPGSTGKADSRIQAYNFRLCLTDDPSNIAPFDKPNSYDRNDYISLINDIKEERVKELGDVIKLERIPNKKTDTNNHHYCLCSTDLPEENDDYPTGNWEIRDKIIKRHIDYTKGLLWFLQNDNDLPPYFREEASKWGYAADEFIETSNFPPQIYVREARRIKGEYVFSENDARICPGMERTPIHPDSIAVGDYAIDSHATRKREEKGMNLTLEGFLGLTWLTEVYQIPYGVIVPRDIEGLLVPVSVSATHMGYGTIRMEPVWLQLGYAAGLAADLSIRHEVQVRNVSVDLLQRELLAHDQKITHFTDVLWNDSRRVATEYFGTKGFFSTYIANLDDPISVYDASLWIQIARMLPGGKSIPVLQASANILPAGVDMGPRLPKEELSPAVYWRENPLLTKKMGKSWLEVAKRELKVSIDEYELNDENDGFITRGDFCYWLYQLIHVKDNF